MVLYDIYIIIFITQRLWWRVDQQTHKLSFQDHDVLVFQHFEVLENIQMISVFVYFIKLSRHPIRSWPLQIELEGVQHFHKEFSLKRSIRDNNWHHKYYCSRKSYFWMYCYHKMYIRCHEYNVTKHFEVSCDGFKAKCTWLNLSYFYPPAK